MACKWLLDDSANLIEQDIVLLEPVNSADGSAYRLFFVLNKNHLQRGNRASKIMQPGVSTYSIFDFTISVSLFYHSKNIGSNPFEAFSAARFLVQSLKSIL